MMTDGAPVVLVGLCKEVTLLANTHEERQHAANLPVLHAT